MGQGQFVQERKINLLIGATGSVASMLLDSIIEAFAKTNNYNIKVILTQHAKIFVDDSIKDYEEFQTKHGVEFYYADEDFTYYKKDKSCPLFVKLSQWTDVLLIVPLSSNTLGKIAMGLCDNLLTHVVRAFDNNKIHFFNLAMNTMMYEKAITEEYIKILTEGYKFIQIPSTSTKLKCEDDGIGAIAETKTLVDTIEQVRDKVLQKKKHIPIITKTPSVI